MIAGARDNLFATPKLRMILDDKGLALVVDAVRARFPDAPPDIICLDPIRNLFDGGEDGGGENDNAAMMFFLTERVERLREAVAPDCGVILAHHTKKMNRKAVGEDPFQALSGASALRGFYTSGLLMHRPDEESSMRKLEIELRNGPSLPTKLIDKENGRWVEIAPLNERLVRKETGARYDAERLRKLALETFDLSKDPYVFRNRVGSCSAAWWSGAAPRSRSLGRAAPPRPPRRAFPRLSAPVPAPAHAQARSSANSA